MAETEKVTGRICPPRAERQRTEASWAPSKNVAPVPAMRGF